MGMVGILLSLAILFVVGVLMIIRGIKTKKKWLIVIPTLLFTSTVIFFYSAFYGVPFGNYIAKAKITDYVKQVYGINKKFQIPQYNFKNSTYSANIPQQSSEFTISYNLLNNSIYDERVNSTYNLQFQKEYMELLKTYSGSIELPPADIYSRILANGNYSDDIYKLTCFQKIYLLGIVNRQKISLNDSTKMPATVTKYVLDKVSNRFNITSLQAIYTDLNGCFEIIVDGNDKPTVEKMQKHTSKMDRIGEVEKKIINELNK
jgi:hypothetical protein